MLIFGNFVPTFVSVVFELFVSVAIIVGSLGVAANPQEVAAVAAVK
jgi:TRAP-type C4-dicarboxylate transport system permease large subunit